MPSSKSARVSKRRKGLNQPLRTKAKTYVTKAKNLLDDGDIEGANEAANQAITALDKAAGKGAIHPNNASRRKSRLLRTVNKAVSAKE